jgi:2-dehydro-3-deoxyphosphogluconate aldolase/(4S)-4-hydroxy-2-oxoglutarate aldolase
VIAGIATATEILQALSAGVEVLKLFPATVLGGPALVEALSAPFPQIRFVPTGGITADTGPDYLAQPSVLAIGGSWMVPRGAFSPRTSMPSARSAEPPRNWPARVTTA